MGNLITSVKNRMPYLKRRKERKSALVYANSAEEMPMVRRNGKTSSYDSSSEEEGQKAEVQIRRNIFRCGTVRTHSVDMTYEEYFTGGNPSRSKRTKRVKRTKSHPHLTTPFETQAPLSTKGRRLLDIHSMILSVYITD